MYSLFLYDVFTGTLIEVNVFTEHYFFIYFYLFIKSLH